MILRVSGFRAPFFKNIGQSWFSRVSHPTTLLTMTACVLSVRISHRSTHALSTVSPRSSHPPCLRLPACPAICDREWDAYRTSPPVSPLEGVEAAKRLAAYTAVDRHIRPEHKVRRRTRSYAIPRRSSQFIGIGSGMRKLSRAAQSSYNRIQAPRSRTSWSASYNRGRSITKIAYFSPPVSSPRNSLHTLAYDSVTSRSIRNSM
jgi:hypothetical protein